MVKFTCTIKKFGEQGEKTGWTYLEVPQDIASQLLPGNKKSFRVRGRLDSFAFNAIALLPAGTGDFIMPLNSDVRKSTGKSKGHQVTVEMEVDNSPVQISPDLMQCLTDEPAALAFFNKLPGSHRKYFSNWIESAKTIETKTKRITQAVIACSRGQHYGEMIRSIKNSDDLLKKF
jgi:hypothetical protein